MFVDVDCLFQACMELLSFRNRTVVSHRSELMLAPSLFTERHESQADIFPHQDLHSGPEHLLQVSTHHWSPSSLVLFADPEYGPTLALSAHNHGNLRKPTKTFVSPE